MGGYITLVVYGALGGDHNSFDIYYIYLHIFMATEFSANRQGVACSML